MRLQDVLKGIDGVGIVRRWSPALGGHEPSFRAVPPWRLGPPAGWEPRPNRLCRSRRRTAAVPCEHPGIWHLTEYDCDLVGLHAVCRDCDGNLTAADQTPRQGPRFDQVDTGNSGLRYDRANRNGLSCDLGG